MSIVNDVSKIGDNHLVTLLGVLSLITPGLGLLLTFYPQTIFTLDIFKLLLISLSVGLLTALPTFLIVALAYGSKLKGEAGIPLFVFATLTCGIITSILQGLFWLYQWPLEVYVIFHALLFFLIIPSTPVIVRFAGRVRG